MVKWTISSSTNRGFEHCSFINRKDQFETIHLSLGFSITNQFLGTPVLNQKHHGDRFDQDSEHLKIIDFGFAKCAAEIFLGGSNETLRLAWPNEFS